MLTSESRKALEITIRELRKTLPDKLKKHTQSRFRLLLTLDKSKLVEPAYTERVRFEQWQAERARSLKGSDKGAGDALLKEQALDAAAHECAATLVNRLVILRAMEARGIAKVKVLTGAKQSAGYGDFRYFAERLCDVSEDESEGFATLLQMVFRELSVELPGLFGDVGVTGLLEVPSGALMDVVNALDEPALSEAWDDDTTPGWVYQYWNDPAREALDEKVNDGKRIEPHEIASKTQMFTERYMVEWLLQNTLGLQWLALCQKNGWTAEALPVIDALEARRSEWRAKRERGEAKPDELMPVAEGLERRWCYWVSQPVPEAMVRSVGDSVREWKVLDPACGSGHFLVIAFGLLFELYREEARHRGEPWSDGDIARWIIEDNLHGVDLDPRAVQLAAASLWLTMKCAVNDRGVSASVRKMNLVATSFDLARLPANDEALVRLESALSSECGLDPKTVEAILRGLKGLDTWGSLVRIHEELDKLLAVDRVGFVGGRDAQLSLGQATTESERSRARSVTASDRALRTRAAVEAKLDEFLSQHTSHADLGVRLGGQQLSAGVRFATMMREGTFDVVIGNPPYQGASRLADATFLVKNYPRGKADLYASFVERGLQLAKENSGLCAMVTMRNWMFLKQYEELRKSLIARDLRCVADVGTGCFSSRSMDDVISASMAVIRAAPRTIEPSVALQAAPLVDPTRDAGKPARRQAALLAQVGRYEFDPSAFSVIEGEPIVYWWSKALLARYASAPKLGKMAPVRLGVRTSDNTRFLRLPWELAETSADRICSSDQKINEGAWVPYIKGAEGRSWFEPLNCMVRWKSAAYEIRVTLDFAYGMSTQSPEFYFAPGIAFSMIGANFSARAHRFHSVIGDKGSSVFAEHTASVLLGMNSSVARNVLQSLNPTVSFQVGDVNRLPLFPVESADAIYARLDEAFTQHERAREASVEFVGPGRSAWAYAQAWAQKAVDRAPGEPLPEYAPSESDSLPPDSASDPTASAEEHEKRAAFDQVSFAIGVAMGRFGAQGEGVLSKAPASALAGGLLFVSATGDRDSLDSRAAAPIRAAWESFGDRVAPGEELRSWLRKGFFALHNERYEKRPIYLPLSSEKKSFVAWVSIHRWTKSTLTELVADHLEPLRRSLDGQLKELRAAKEGADKKSRTENERRSSELTRLVAELAAFIEDVRAIHDRGAPPPSDKCPERERDHRFEMDLDDGVMVNSAALWPLLDPQWKDPKKWWTELAKADGRKDYDWSHMAARYWPKRVRAKCVEDPSLAVAHGCFWELHPEKAWQWEQRLKGELGDHWVIDEAGASERRAAWQRANSERANAIIEDERRKRERKSAAASEERGEAEGEGELFSE